MAPALYLSLIPGPAALETDRQASQASSWRWLISSAAELLVVEYGDHYSSDYCVWARLHEAGQAPLSSAKSEVIPPHVSRLC